MFTFEIVFEIVVVRDFGFIQLIFFNSHISQILTNQSSHNTLLENKYFLIPSLSSFEKVQEVWKMSLNNSYLAERKSQYLTIRPESFALNDSTHYNKITLWEKWLWSGSTRGDQVTPNWRKWRKGDMLTAHYLLSSYRMHQVPCNEIFQIDYPE